MYCFVFILISTASLPPLFFRSWFMEEENNQHFFLEKKWYIWLFVQKSYKKFFFSPSEKKCIHPYSTDNIPCIFSSMLHRVIFSALCIIFVEILMLSLTEFHFFFRVAYLDVHRGYVILLQNSRNPTKSLLTNGEFKTEMQSFDKIFRTIWQF